MQIPVNNNLKLQSPFLYCQAAGSNGSDGTEEGIHLRWDLMQELGNDHIPKGNLFYNRTGENTWFNKQDDFIGIYRAAAGNISQAIEIPSLQEYVVLQDGPGLSFDMGGYDPHTIIVRFTDGIQFKNILNSNPHSLYDFLSAYHGIVELEIRDELIYRYEIYFSANNPAIIPVETVMTGHRFEKSAERVSRRDLIDTGNQSGINVSGENIKYIRWRNDPQNVLNVFVYERYAVAFRYYQDGQHWHKIGDFSLSMDDAEVYTWFQGSQYNGGGLTLNWPKYNEGVMVNPANYMDRWEYGDDGMKAVIDKFIDASIHDTRANVSVPSEGGEENNLTISLLDMLRLSAMDYHAARMMGLGALDKEVAKAGEQKYVYAAVYTTYPELPYVGKDVDHVFLTLPTNCYDYRLPVPPVLHDITYGLYVDTDGSGVPSLISDPDGYSFYDEARFINLSKTNENEPQKVATGIPPVAFDATNITQPSGFGIEYKADWEGSWRLPEILHDELYTDQNGIYESIFTPEKDFNPLYVHQEREQGVHQYALYAVNWFNRVSDLSETRSTDYTNFPKRNRLLPPANIGVQYIQEEDPLMFTTQQEQNELEAANTANPNGDNYKTRVIFEWNEVQNMAYQSADKVLFYFREAALMKVEGAVNSVSSISEKLCTVTTTGFTMNSFNPPVPVTPQIAPPDADKFTGSYFCTPGGQFRIVSVDSTGTNPSFTIEKISSLQAVQGNPDDAFTTISVYQQPKAGDVFFIYENANTESAWQLLNKTVDLVPFSNTTEVIYEDDGSSHTETVGGIYEAASVTPITQNIGGVPVPTEGYTVVFNNYNLADHPDSAVKWMKGSVRMELDGSNQKRSMPVASIVSRQPLQLIVFDPEYHTAPFPVKTGSNINVNYHPGYKVYLSPQPGVFGKPQVMPAGNALNKKTFIALRSLDSSYGFQSAFTPPVTLVGRNVQKPAPPEAVIGPLFATRPDFYGKSTYTIDVTLGANGRTPYGLIVYKATEMAILQALYTPATITTILSDLEAISGNDQYKFNRWQELVNVVTDTPAQFQFRMVGTYRFPNPDNPATTLPVTITGTTITENAAASTSPFPLDHARGKTVNTTLVQRAIEDAFVAITETPMLFEYLKQGVQTSSDKPKAHDILGRLLSPADPAFNPFPMAVKLPVTDPNKRTVRVTDYSINGNSRNIYFYFAREVSMNTQFSGRSAVTGPVVLVDAHPPEKPVIRKVISREANSYLGQRAAIEFEIAPYISMENITRFQVFRTYDVHDAANTRKMTHAADLVAGATLADEFRDLEFPPFGQPLYYRVVALREILNERGQTEYIPSQPSEVIMTSIMDVTNPLPPVLEAESAVEPLTGNLLNVSLTWHPTVFNGTYYVYKMNEKGNWEKLYKVRSNKPTLEFPEGGNYAAHPEMALLRKTDDDGNTIYHRFKINVENASGLFNLEEKELVM